MRNDRWRRSVAPALFCCALSLLVRPAAGSEIVPPPSPDPHYTEVGFFDVRLCNWPEGERFVQVLFSTFHYDSVRQVEVEDPQGRRIGEVALDKYRLLRTKDGREKRVFISRLPLSSASTEGWYTGRIRTASGKTYLARDLVKLEMLPMANNLKPSSGAEGIEAPAQLSWDAVPSANMYQVFIHDIWDGEQLIFRSPHLRENRVTLPPGLLKPGGYYMWRVHARDVDEHPDLGDFNHGSLSPFHKFSVR